ncbi:ankyrin repeat and zinc finger domain-containing protein 1-like isoform X1 [Chenopodium quinoa]|uniref:ankyrin repeat and zinc finger domain-containing protein 1-like isoform X1 n=1 Tax=Chenopodium quinoa TaxID=63459 RepID=UPI000B780221|nr:ankyrin repeat and zinc finger domain-containing protein 1-like isoform X1 [Chenopodium quinoa]
MATTGGSQQPDKRPQSIFDLPQDFFDCCRLLPPAKLHHHPPSSSTEAALTSKQQLQEEIPEDDEIFNDTCNFSMNTWSCNICKSEFDSLLDQRSHFKSDLHRFNVKLNLAGKVVLNEDAFDELTSDSFTKDFDVSSISGSEDEDERGSRVRYNTRDMSVQSIKQKLCVHLQSGEKVSIWKCFLLKDNEDVSYENNQLVVVDDNGRVPDLKVIERLKSLTHEPRDNTHLRIVLLASGGHFAGCVFDGNTVITYKTFHRYVVRAKAGKRQSTKDASGRSIHSAGASLRRYNELALKKDIQELLASWKPYFDASSCVFIYAPSSNRQMFYNGEGPLLSNQQCDARNIPFSVRRPTLKEARRIYNQLSLVVYENEEELPDIKQIDLNVSCVSDANILKGAERGEVKVIKEDEVSGSGKISDEESSSEEGDKELGHTTTPLHEAAKSDNPEKVLELLEQGLDPTVKDERGKAPYMVATDKEVRNTFRRFMALNLEKWDWHAANVPSALTKEMEESQAAKQAEKDAKRKAKAKELKKQRKAREREKKAEVKAAESQKIATAAENKSTASRPVRTVQSVIAARLSKEEELKRKQIEEREKRAAAAERRLALAAAAANAQGASSNPTTASSSQPKTNIGSTDTVCSCCNASLEGKVPFHRYNYKYCSTTCMQVHREFLEDG